MEVIAIKNNHRKKEEKKYGCVCPRCGSVFIFSRSEATIPRSMSYTDRDCSICCPNCKIVLTLDKCKELKDEKAVEEFKSAYAESVFEQ